MFECLPLFIRACLPMFTHVYSSLPMFTLRLGRIINLLIQIFATKKFEKFGASFDHAHDTPLITVVLFCANKE